MALVLDLRPAITSGDIYQALHRGHSRVAEFN